MLQGDTQRSGATKMLPLKHYCELFSVKEYVRPTDNVKI